MITEIQNTETYKSLSLMQKQIILKRQNRLNIKHAFVVCKNTSFAQWDKQHDFSKINRGIVKDLIDKI